MSKLNIENTFSIVVIKELRRTIKQKKIQKSSIYKGIVIRVKKKSLSLIHTYSNFEDKDAVSATNLANNYNLKHNIVSLDYQDVPEFISKAIHYLEQPFPGLVTLAKYKLFHQCAKKSSKIFLEGQVGY